MKPRWIALARPLIAGLESVRRMLQPGLDRTLSSWREDDRRMDAGFGGDADRAMLAQEPLRARMLVNSLGVVFILAVLWAGLSEVDEITKGEGKVIPSRQLQVLQSLDGGIVSEILVQEGQVVEPGQVLVNIDTTRFDSSVKENRVQYLALLAKAARLRALAEGVAFVPPPEAVAEAPKTVGEELRSYEASTSTLNAQLAIARQQLAQRQQELVEVRAKREQASRAYELTARELGYTKPLLKDGAVSEVELLRLERETGRFLGEREMASAQISKTQSAIEEASRKIQEITLNFQSEARKELSDTLAKLNVSSAGGVGLADKVDKSSLRSPVKGTVKRLLVNTVGGVVQPGRDIIEIVPLEENLLLEAKVLPKDIAFLRPGDRALVKFTAYDFSIYGGLEAKLEFIGADSVTDERGNTFYTVRVRTEKSKLGEGLPIIPGMVAEVDIITGQKSILSYLLKPVLKAKQAAFTER
ncbi:MAG: HlyD family type I secretion periplasmic adaptor subunit [Polaromonas sp.]|uniref:HlyD family type I secretion periplasmic adaptor subunit n=1 Tax=Polaromonas sp. TaxID=1869339 RepID=UPI00272FCFEB|nr:HlyD family type I secretion periplasmic adaptor subunit [Polaromonas sp.]MDP2452196.1 HlyD family type I secretion periplasmic adaptor subunit [Polaromonas sp.]MDP3245567.1 HlyD family type I secretion periplasmic adaptor subunit [Polaromonas sp.]MDP3826649.1 HlyD family type I secretion periplasmic adaptor subunit [Polaromonas sp.]